MVGIGLEHEIHVHRVQRRLTAHENAIKIPSQLEICFETCWCNLSLYTSNNCRQRLIAFRFCLLHATKRKRAKQKIVAHRTIEMNCTLQVAHEMYFRKKLQFFMTIFKSYTSSIAVRAGERHFAVVKIPSSIILTQCKWNGQSCSRVVNFIQSSCML